MEILKAIWRRPGTRLVTLKWLASLVVSVVVTALASGAVPARACDTWVALPDATADHSIIMAKNSDRPPMEAQPLVYFPHQKHAPGEMVKCTYIEIPQVAETYEHIGSKIWWAFGYEHGMNEFGVAIGNEAVFSKEPYQWGDGLLGMDLLRLGLERGKTAYEAMHVIIALLEKYGQSGDAEYAGEWGKANYHNSFIVADPREAWVLETAGRYWVAKRLTRGVYSISNIYTIEKDWDEAHPRLVEHAIEMGWTKSAATFNFARDYGDYWRKDSANPGNMQIRRNMTLACLRKDFAQVTPRQHDEDQPEPPGRHSRGATLGSPRDLLGHAVLARLPACGIPQRGVHRGPPAGGHAPAAAPGLLGELLESLRERLQAVLSPRPDGSRESTRAARAPIPAIRRGGGPIASSCCATSTTAPWRRPCGACSTQTERWEMDRQKNVEAEALRQINAGKDAEAVRDFSRNSSMQNCERVEREYRMLNESLPADAEDRGMEYLFTSYLQEWTSKKGVPLPLP